MTDRSTVDEGRGSKEVAAALREARSVQRRAEKLNAAVANLGDETLQRMTKTVLGWHRELVGRQCVGI
jgi:hypothetical protein